ncbi:MAG TPA: hypothetical protein VFT99_07655, partial [Roseiflexaceae bacterium]|nr:hypothetical protein [Roseiflexaceae bacterium]
MSLRRILTSAATLVLALLLVAAAVQLVVRPEPRDRLRQADGAMLAGHYYDALQQYAAVGRLAPHFAPAQARIGMVYAVRGERQAATQALARALNGNLSVTDVDLVRLYQGVIAIQEGDDPRQFWRLIAPQGPLYGISRVLDGEYRTANADYAGAEAALREALGTPLPTAWRQAAHTSLALLRASSDPATAQRELSQAVMNGRPEMETQSVALAA